MLRQVWPSAGCARQVVPHDPLPHEIIESVLLSPDLSGAIFSQLCNTVDPGAAVAFSSASSELWALTHAQRQQLKADYNAAATLSLKLGMQGCKELREATTVEMRTRTCLSEDDLATFGTLGSLLPALKKLAPHPLCLNERAAGHDGVQRLAEKLGAGALPALTFVSLYNMHVGDAGASALAAALDRSALPRLEELWLRDADIGDAGLLALAPALRQRPALETLGLAGNPFGDEGLAALVAPPPADAPPPQAEVLAKLECLYLDSTQITDAGCTHLASRLWSGALPALNVLCLRDTPVNYAAIAALYEARGAGLGGVYNARLAP